MDRYDSLQVIDIEKDPVVADAPRRIAVNSASVGRTDG
jgi:hypothetical protein